jgi:hypothetical protein
VVIEYRRPADGDGEDFCKFLESTFDPFLTVPGRFAQEECSAHATSDAVMQHRQVVEADRDSGVIVSEGGLVDVQRVNMTRTSDKKTARSRRASRRVERVK